MHLLVTAQMAERLGAQMRSIDPCISLVTLDAAGRWQGDPTTVEAGFLSFDSYAAGTVQTVLRSLPTMPALRWLHTYAIGVDHPMYRPIVEHRITLTNGAGSQHIPIAQHVLLMMLYHAKRMDVWVRAQTRQQWTHAPSEELTGKTVALLGVGGIGSEVARLAQAFGMRVIGLRRTQQPVANVDVLLPPDALDELCAQADFLIVCTPLTRLTRGLVGAVQFARMKRTAYLINVARGPIVDEAALINALRSSQIAGAALDVFDHEPLPAGHPFWTMPNMVITPHTAPASPLYIQRGGELFLDNLGRYIAGEPLRNVVDPADLGVGDDATSLSDRFGGETLARHLQSE